MQKDQARNSLLARGLVFHLGDGKFVGIVFVGNRAIAPRENTNVDVARPNVCNALVCRSAIVGEIVFHRRDRLLQALEMVQYFFAELLQIKIR